MRTLLLFALAAALASGGCAAKKPQSADEYFEKAHQDYRRGSYTLAIQSFRELLDRHPFSDYAEEAELRIAHAHYLAGDYTAAIVTLTDFQRRHPTSEHLPFAGYLLGMCYVRQMGSHDRDQTAARNAHSYFATLLQQYPESPFADLARIELTRCRESLAASELYVADFYAKQGNPDAARVRLLNLASRFSETPTAAVALLRLTRDFVRQDKHEHAVLAARALEALHPNRYETERVRTLVDSEARAAVPPTTDPLDLLMIAHGRRREDVTYGIPKVPVRDEQRRPRVGGPGMPRTDPFGRGSQF